MPVYDSTSAFLKQQLKNFREASKADKVLRAAALYAAPEVMRRVQKEGEKSDGSQIGQYGQRVIPSAFGKAQSFASKKRLKTLSSTDSYKQLRQKLGLQTAFIDFTFSGDMWKSWLPVPISNTAYGVTFTSPEQLKIANSLESRFGTTFELSEEELAQSLQIINRLAIEFLSK
jgi:hypothetical protein